MNLAEVSIKRPVFATMLIAALMVFGLLAYPKVGVDLFPNVEFPYVTVTVIYPGSDPSTMEREVAEPIEEAVNTLGGIRSLRSINQESVSFVVIEFELEVDAEKAVQDVRDKVARIQNQLPAAAEQPKIERLDVGAAPIMTVAIAGDLPPRELTRLADKEVKERLQRIRGVGGIDLVGSREREIHVYVDADRIGGFGLTVEDVATAIRAQSLEVPAGSFDRGTQQLTVKTKGEVRSVEELGDIVIPASRGNVRLREVATVIDGVQEVTSASFLDGKPGISLVIRKQSGTNSVAVAKAVKAALDELRPQIARAGATLTLPTDNSVYIEQSIDDVQFDLVFGGVLAVVVIFFFLVNFRATFISAIAIPTSLIATFAFIQTMGFTFNNMTMLALSLAIGILIDDAIVVMENIHRHLEMKKSALQAASDGTAEIFLSVLAMTSTILAVFVPVAVMKGIIGRFFLQFGLTVSFAVATSMLVSFTLTPVLSSRILEHGHGRGWLIHLVDKVMDWLEHVYARIIRWSLRYRLATVGIAVAALVSSAFLVTHVKSEFMPPEDRSQFLVKVELPTGTGVELTSRVTEAIAGDLRTNISGVKNTLTQIAAGAQGQPNQGEIRVALVGRKTRSFSQQDLMAWARQRYAGIQNVRVSVTELGMIEGGGRTEPIQLCLRGGDLESLVKAADAVKADLVKLPGFVDVDVSYRGGKPELGLNVDRDRAASLGVPIASLATTIRSLMAGDTVSELKDGTDAYDITLQLPPEQRERILSLNGLQVRAMNGGLIELSDVVHANLTSGPDKIERLNRQRQITVYANLQGLPLGEAKMAVDAAVARVVPPTINASHEGMAKIMSESFGYMVEALFLAIVLVYMILAAQFNSFIQPVTIMVSLPLSVIGAFGGLYLFNMTLSIFSMIGVIMLMGIVTKNAILMVDFANQQRAEGTPLMVALERAGVLRLRPILMTSVAMIFGMLPVALALGEGGEVRAPMAVCVIGGLITSTLLTLVVVPVLYVYVDQAVNSRAVNWLGSKVLAPDDDTTSQSAESTLP
jgi:HAE1 family hydrophobic/amphiphilic exporter-1